MILRRVDQLHRPGRRVNVSVSRTATSALRLRAQSRALGYLEVISPRAPADRAPATAPGALGCWLERGFVPWAHQSGAPGAGRRFFRGSARSRAARRTAREVTS